MVSLLTQRDMRSVQYLDFCYVCGRNFVVGDEINRDHIPAQSVFSPRDRQPLWLPTHKACNSQHGLIDEKIGQLIALRRRETPPRPENRRLKFAMDPSFRLGAVINVPIDMAVWRWIRAFHSALYQEPATDIRGALVTPFPRGQRVNGNIVVEELRPQHRAFVETIKINRANSNLDRISSNNGKLKYECVWCLSDDQRVWMCIFALDIYDWKDLGRTRHFPARGCAGFYVRPSNDVPTNSTRAIKSKISIPNFDPLDPFGR